MSHRKLFLVVIVFLSSFGLVFAAGWQTDYAKALETAKGEKKRVLLDFTGSDWCGPCIQLEREVFSRPEFKSYSEKNLVLVEIDFPQRKQQSAELVKQNQQLAKQYGIGVKGYPTLVLLDPAGKVMREFSGYGGETPAELVAWIEGKSNR
jgi:thioredoxin-related protein